MSPAEGSAAPEPDSRAEVSQSVTIALEYEDGPALRSQLSLLEAKASELKRTSKALLKAAEHSLETLRSTHDAELRLNEALSDLSCTSNSVASLCNSYLRDARQLEQSAAQDAIIALDSGLCEPLRKDIAALKSVEGKRKAFDAESKAYYESTSKYLAKGARDVADHEDEKHALCVAKFALARFEYQMALQDAAVFGEAHIVTLLTHWARVKHQLALNEGTNSAGFKAALDGCIAKEKELDRSVQSYRGHMHTHRETLELAYRQAVKDAGGAEDERQGRWRHESKDASRAAEDGHGTVRRQGFLWTAAHSAGKHWHKYWVILADGALTEYVGWRSCLEIHDVPIKLRLATVRDARLPDRRFSFDVITNELKRTYQASSEIEAAAWKRAIAQTIESLLNEASSARTGSRPARTTSGLRQHPGESPSTTSVSGLGILGGNTSKNAGRRVSAKNHRKRDSAAQLFQAGLSSLGIGPKERQASDRHSPLSDASTPPLLYAERFTSAGDLQSKAEASSEMDAAFDRRIAESVQSQSLMLSPADLEKARNAKVLLSLLKLPGNQHCFDCDTADPRWSAWSLGIFLCIDCCGVHRSLGSHISKVRSVELDDWTSEQVAAVSAIGNERARDLYGGPAASPAEAADLIRQRYTPHTAAIALSIRKGDGLAF